MVGFNAEATNWLQSTLIHSERWLSRTVLDWSNAWQVGATLAAVLVARLLLPRVRRGLGVLVAQRGWAAGGRAKILWAAIHVLIFPALWLLGQWVATMALAQAGQPSRLSETVADLLSAWLVIRLSTAFLAGSGWSRLVATIAWAAAALDITGLWGSTIRLLDHIGMDFGTTRVSLLLVIRAFIALASLLWLSGVLSRAMEKRILALPDLTPSARVLFTKVAKVTVVTLGIILALKSVGIDLSAFALLSGAIGLGVGFGLQKVVSNLISGVILLLDKSIKPGDVISLGETYGWIASLGARYVSVITVDGIEYLIPNEELITQRVENWTFTHDRVRLRIPVGVAYDTDLHQAMALCIEAARAAPRILADPPPICLLTGFGASSLDLELRCWIADPKHGISEAKSGVLIGIWERFRRDGIEIPYPQQDVRIKEMPPAAPAAQSQGAGLAERVS